MSSGGSGSTNTVTSAQQIPLFEQQASENNQALAQSIGSQPYPTYQGALIQGMDPLQTQGQNLAVQSASSYGPLLNDAVSTTGQGANATNFGTDVGGASSSAYNALNLTNPSSTAAYMTPYEQQALAPSIQDLQLQLAGQQQGINTTATQANAFGDARQGAAQSLQNLYGNQALNQLVGTGYNNAYTAAQAAQGQAENTSLGAGQIYGSLANAQNAEQNTQLTAGTDLGSLANQQQQQQIAGANAVYGAGAQNQALGQSQLTAAYQQYLNQINWPTQMLNVQESALSNSPYNIATAVTLPQANSVAQGVGGVTSLAGLLGTLGSTSSSANAPFGGAAIATGSK